MRKKSYRDLELELLELQREREFDSERFVAKETIFKQKAEVEKTELISELKIGLAARNEKIDQLEKRLAESPYSQLQDILKALVVKLPTLNINELCVNSKEK